MIVKAGKDIIGTARVTLLAGNTTKIERMAVLKSFRRKGIGRGIVAFLKGELKSRQVKYTFLHAQQDAIAFYQSCGFQQRGTPFSEAGIKHIKMEIWY